MLDEKLLKRVKEVRGLLDGNAKEIKDMMVSENKSIVASIDETMQQTHIEVFQELVITQTIITLQTVLIDALLNEEFEDDEESGVVASIDVLTDCLNVQELDVAAARMVAWLADNELLNELEEDE